MVSFENWWLDIDIPEIVVRDTRFSANDLMRTHGRFHLIARTLKTDRDVVRIGVGDPNVAGARMLLHPGQQVLLDGNHLAFCPILLEVNSSIYQALSGSAKGRIEWTLYLPDSNPQTGAIPFDDWSNF